MVTQQHKILKCILLVIFILQETGCLLYSGPAVGCVTQLFHTTNAVPKLTPSTQTTHAQISQCQFPTVVYLNDFSLDIQNFENSAHYLVYEYHAINLGH
jgi:hypothetical protein